MMNSTMLEREGDLSRLDAMSLRKVLDMSTEATPEFLAISVDFAKLNGFPSASLVTRLALAYNDIASAVRLLDPTRSSDPSQLADVALSLYATRILLGHFSEAVALVESVQGTKELQP